MLNLIDNLPVNSKIAEAMSLDKDHQALVRETMRVNGIEMPSYAPPLSAWTMEASLLASLIDSVNSLRDVTIVVNGDGKNKPKPTAPQARPRSVSQEIDRAARRASHERLSDMILSRRGKVVFVPPEARTAAPESVIERVTGVQQNEPDPGTMSGDAT